MAEWHFMRGWSECELEERHASLRGRRRNFEHSWERMRVEPSWRRYASEAVVAIEAPGLPEPGGAFERASSGLANYMFSDPEIVTAHFDPDEPLAGRRMLLEIRVLGLHYLCGVVVAAVRSDHDAEGAAFGFRYDTLEGHIERGAEWFLLHKRADSGEVRFRIEAAWREGDFPNWWSHVGFKLLAPRYQRRWHVRAQHRIALLARHGSLSPPLPPGGRLVHEGPDVILEGFGRRWP